MISFQELNLKKIWLTFGITKKPAAKSNFNDLKSFFK